MIPSYLLGIVVDKHLDAGLHELDLGEDLVRGGRPCERFRISIPVIDVVADLPNQDRNGRERAAPDGLAGDDAEPGLDLVDPRRPDRREMEMHMRVLFQPRHDVRCRVRRQISSTT